MSAPDLAAQVQFLDQPDERGHDVIIPGLARVMTVDGPVPVAGVRLEGVPHLAVTQCTPELGHDVTHLPTGVTVLRHFASFGAALLALVQLHAVRTHYRLDFAGPEAADLREAFASVDAFPVPFVDGFGAPRPSVGVWLAGSREYVARLQLPWESSQALVREAMTLLAECDRLAVPPAAAETTDEGAAA